MRRFPRIFPLRNFEHPWESFSDAFSVQQTLTHNTQGYNFGSELHTGMGWGQKET
jgi:hypothetical protein